MTAVGAKRTFGKAATDAGMDSVDMLEIDMIEDLWRSGSIRRLARIVEAFVDACDNPQRVN
jgi:hypothetical protein